MSTMTAAISAIMAQQSQSARDGEKRKPKLEDGECPACDGRGFEKKKDGEWNYHKKCPTCKGVYPYVPKPKKKTKKLRESIVIPAITFGMSKHQNKKQETNGNTHGVCPDCHGGNVAKKKDGSWDYDKPCPTCKGEVPYYSKLRESMLKNNKHRDLHNALTDGRMSPEDYDKAIKKHERESMRAMLRQNMLNAPKPYKGK